MALRALAETAMRHPGCRVAYMGLTYPAAMGLCWKPLKDLSREHKLKWKFNKVERIIYLPNGSEIFVFAGDRGDDVDKMRGFAFKRFVIDECASYGPHFGDLIRRVIEPALGDERGDLWLIGTPGDVPAGYFYEATQPKEKRKQGFKKWSLHHWTVLDNPFFKDAAAWIEEEKESNNYTDDDPVFLQEYRGVWAPNTSKLVYKFLRSRNVVSDCPFELRTMTLVLGIDFGVVDGFALVVIGYHYSSPNTYVLYADVETGLAPSQGVDKIRDLQKAFFRARHGREHEREEELDEVFDHMVADTQGQGKAWVQEYALRTGFVLEAADKQDKRVFIDHINSDYRQGRLLLVDDTTRPLQNELERLPWKDEYRLVEHKQYPNHLADAHLYAWRRSRAYDARDHVQMPDVGTKEWYELREQEYEADVAVREEARVKKRNADREQDYGALEEYDDVDQGTGEQENAAFW